MITDEQRAQAAQMAQHPFSDEEMHLPALGLVQVRWLNAVGHTVLEGYASGKYPLDAKTLLIKARTEIFECLLEEGFTLLPPGAQTSTSDAPVSGELQWDEWYPETRCEAYANDGDGNKDRVSFVIDRGAEGTFLTIEKGNHLVLRPTRCRDIDDAKQVAETHYREQKEKRDAQ